MDTHKKFKEILWRYPDDHKFTKDDLVKFIDGALEGVSQTLIKYKIKHDKQQQKFIDVLIDYGLSIVESNRVFESKRNFELAIKDIIEKHKMEVSGNSSHK